MICTDKLARWRRDPVCHYLAQCGSRTFPPEKKTKTSCPCSQTLARPCDTRRQRAVTTTATRPSVALSPCGAPRMCEPCTPDAASPPRGRTRATSD
eukprot:scaffold23077_cov68-Phaeocystis_antarctica.AAC.5